MELMVKRNPNWDCKRELTRARVFHVPAIVDDSVIHLSFENKDLFSISKHRFLFSSIIRNWKFMSSIFSQFFPRFSFLFPLSWSFAPNFFFPSQNNHMYNFYFFNLQNERRRGKKDIVDFEKKKQINPWAIYERVFFPLCWNWMTFGL